MRRPALALLAAVIGIASCQHLSSWTCPTGLKGGRTATLYFGRNIGDQEGVSAEAFARFVDEEVVPRFPSGFTVIDAKGQWRGADGATVREPSEVVQIVLSGVENEQGKLNAIRTAYETRFSQEAVLLVVKRACVGF